MWTTIIFDVVAGLFVGMAIVEFINLRWVRRLPALETAGHAQSHPHDCSLPTHHKSVHFFDAQE